GRLTRRPRSSSPLKMRSTNRPIPITRPRGSGTTASSRRARRGACWRWLIRRRSMRRWRGRGLGCFGCEGNRSRFMQVFATVLAGVIVFILGQLVQQFVLAPIKEFNKERGDTSYLLLRYQALITNASNRNEKAIEEI